MNKGRGRSQLAQVYNLFARTRCFIPRRNCPQNEEHGIPRHSSVVWFTTTLAMFILEIMFILITLVTIIVLVFLEKILVLVTLKTNPVLKMTLENEPSTLLILETGCVLKLTFKEMMKVSFRLHSSSWFELYFQFELSCCCFTK